MIADLGIAALIELLKIEKVCLLNVELLPMGCGMEAVALSKAKATSEQPGLLLNNELKMIAPNSILDFRI